MNNSDFFGSLLVLVFWIIFLVVLLFGKRQAATHHDYLSTACHHGILERCRKECKFCAVLCKCACHGNPDFSTRK